MNKIPVFLLILGLVLAASCSYTNSEIYYVEPIAGDSTLISVTTSLDTVSEIIITDSLLVSWEATVERGEFYHIEALLSNYLIYEMTPDYNPDTVIGSFVIRDSFWISVDLPLVFAIHPLDMYFYTSSNTNSLGDYYKVEARTLLKEFQINLGGVGK